MEKVALSSLILFGLIFFNTDAFPAVSTLSLSGKDILKEARTFIDSLTISELFIMAKFETLDGNGDGEIRMKEVQSWLEEISHTRGQTFRRSEARETLESRDLNGDNGISRTEWERTNIIPDSVFNKAFAFDFVDSNRDGKITLSEFRKWTQDYTKVFGTEDYYEEEGVDLIFEMRDENSDDIISRSEWNSRSL